MISIPAARPARIPAIGVTLGGLGIVAHTLAGGAIVAVACASIERPTSGPAGAAPTSAPTPQRDGAVDSASSVHILPAPPAIDTSAWLSADPATQPFTPSKRSNCVVDGRCNTLPLPRCPSNVSALDLAELLPRAEANLGRMVLVRGRLRPHGTILTYECSPRCCHRRGAKAALVPETERRSALLDRIVVDDIGCHGDESGDCCSVAMPANVMALGRLERAGLQSHVPWRLAGARLCSLDAPGVPEGLRASETGCVLDDRQFEESERVIAGSVMCGCHAGNVFCSEHVEGRCFHKGSWFADGDVLVTDWTREERTCRSGQWQTKRVMPLASAFAALKFDARSSVLSNEAAVSLDTFRPVKPAEQPRVELRAWIDAAEGRGARGLAAARARAVQKRLVDNGHDPAFIETTFEELAPGVDANGVRVTLHNALPR